MLDYNFEYDVRSKEEIYEQYKDNIGKYDLQHTELLKLMAKAMNEQPTTQPDRVSSLNSAVLVNKISEFFPDGFECESYQKNTEVSDWTLFYVSETRPPHHIFDIVHGSYEYRIYVDQPHMGDATAWLESVDVYHDPKIDHDHTTITTDKCVECLEQSINYILNEFTDGDIEPVTIGSFNIPYDTFNLTIEDDNDVVAETTDETDQLITEEDIDESIDETLTVGPIEVDFVDEDSEDDEDDGFVYECAIPSCDETVTQEKRYPTIRHECDSCDRTTQFNRQEDT